PVGLDRHQQPHPRRRLALARRSLALGPARHASLVHDRRLDGLDLLGLLLARVRLRRRSLDPRRREHDHPRADRRERASETSSVAATKHRASPTPYIAKSSANRPNSLILTCTSDQVRPRGSTTRHVHGAPVLLCL